jgi:hypothetical protein
MDDGEQGLERQHLTAMVDQGQNKRCTCVHGEKILFYIYMYV